MIDLGSSTSMPSSSSIPAGLLRSPGGLLEGMGGNFEVIWCLFLLGKVGRGLSGYGGCLFGSLRVDMCSPLPLIRSTFLFLRIPPLGGRSSSESLGRVPIPLLKPPCIRLRRASSFLIDGGGNRICLGSARDSPNSMSSAFSSESISFVVVASSRSSECNDEGSSVVGTFSSSSLFSLSLDASRFEIGDDVVLIVDKGVVAFRFEDNVVVDVTFRPDIRHEWSKSMNSVAQDKAYFALEGIFVLVAPLVFADFD